MSANGLGWYGGIILALASEGCQDGTTKLVKNVGMMGRVGDSWTEAVRRLDPS